MKKWLSQNDFRIWLAIVGAATLVIGAAYTMTQQSTRLTTDDLPLQTAQTMKRQLANGATAQDVMPNIKTNFRDDSTVFAIVTDRSLNIQSSSASLDGKTPLPPNGVFDFTKEHGTDHFTWEPANNVRLATRILPYDSSGGGYIITGQSLKQAEDRIDIYGALALAAWAAVIGWTTLVLFFLKASK